LTRRETVIHSFLTAHGYGRATIQPLAQDASFRRYWRLVGGPCPAVLMDAPPPEDVRPFLHVGAHLARLGASVPETLAAEAESGLLLIEDFGDGLLPTLLSPDTEAMLFDAAVDVLAAMQRVPAPDGLPAWDPATMAATASGTLLDWWWPAAFGTPAPDAARSDFTEALADLLRPLAAEQPVFVHRDFFTGNLMWLPDRSGLRRIGVLDFQGAARGHPAYDLASLIGDCRRDVSPAIAERAVGRFLLLRPELDGRAMQTAVAICAAQRHLRVAGQWVRLAQRDSRTQYLAHGPRTWRLLAEALRHPPAAPLARAFDRWIPPERRGNPPGLPA
jgi:aminoglycoside/choline kinase family phosphotransferase